MKSIEREIAELENKYEIKEEIIKEFIEIISEDKIFIPIEHYKDIYTLSNHFCIPKLTNLLDDMMEKLLVNDLNFSIQILLDNESDNKKEKEEKTELTNKIENFLKSRVNECLKNDKFKELPISMIYRIIDSAISKDRETVDVNNLLDFILESAKNRFILFKFVELSRLRNDKIDDFIKFIDEQEESSKQIYSEYIPFNFSFIKEMKHSYDELSNNFNRIQEELKHANEKFKQTKEELTQTKKELTQTKEELKQTKEELQLFKKQFVYGIRVGGNDDFNQLGEMPNKEYDDYLVIHPPLKSSIDQSLLLSFSIYWHHSVEVTRSGKLLAIGDNRDGRISDSLPKTKIREFTEFSITDSSGRQLDPLSAVCCFYGTLYMLSSGSKRHLVFCDKDINGGHPVFLDIGDEYPVSLFGGNFHSAAITNKGEIIFINRDAVKKSPESNIKSICLPDGEKAVCVACCYDSVVALSSNGRVFLSAIESGSNFLKFSSVSELSDHEIVWMSGTFNHFLAVSRTGRVFGRGTNSHGELGLKQKTDKVISFTEILSLKDHKIKAAYAGSWHSLFETNEGKIIACGQNNCSQLLLNKATHENAYTPTETSITESASFCIAGQWVSIAFIGDDPPPNMPNMPIQLNYS